MRMSKSQETTGDDGDKVALVIYTCEVGYLLVEQSRKLGISNARRSVGDAFDRCSRGKIKFHEKAIELSQRAAQGMPNLYFNAIERDGSIERPMTKLTSVTLVVRCVAMSRFTSVRIWLAVFSCASAKPE